MLGCALCQAQEVDTQVAGNEEVARYMQQFEPRGVMSDGSSPTPPQLAVQQFSMPQGLGIQLVAAEPDISQPLFVSWDSHCRMWVVQYRQYQFPAGLKIVRYDQHLRAVFDRVPDPPPFGIPGEDRITVYEDTDGDGYYDHHRDVIQGLNIATSVQIGHGGIWVLNPPYLLFYRDADGDCVPDTKPEVHLYGFGLQDTHSVANSLLWGPDGWLYGANGSTTVGTVSSVATKGVEFSGQCIWRYHPDSKVFEIYAEGGGNTFSLDIDSKGRVFSGTNGGGTRGFYYPQGSYSSKNWGKHGPLTNPYAFGYFQQMPSEGDTRRFPQAFTIYEGGLLPREYEGNILAPNALANLIWHSERIPMGSSYRTVDLTNMCETLDRWFRPVHAAVGPDGAVYIADWYDTRLSHVSPIDDWHKSSGRVYRILPEGANPAHQPLNLANLDSDGLISLFEHSNRWVRQRAALELGWRGDQNVVPLLRDLAIANRSLEALWALNLLGQMNEDLAVKLLISQDPDIRCWTVRLLGDQHLGMPAVVAAAAQESDVQVRSQMAASSKRFPTEIALPLIGNLLKHSEDLKDPHMPLMLWWGVEAHVNSWPKMVKWLKTADVWDHPVFREAIASKLMQRLVATGRSEDLQRCAELMRLAPNAELRDLFCTGFLAAFTGKPMPILADEIQISLEDYKQRLGADGLLVSLKQGTRSAIETALKELRDSSTPLPLRCDLALALGETQDPQSLSALLALATGRGGPEPALQRAALVALRSFDVPEVGANLVGNLGGSISAEYELRDTACRTLVSRTSWTENLLNEIVEWRFKKEELPQDVIQHLRSLTDPSQQALVVKAIGPAVEISSAAKQAQWQQLMEIWRSAPGNATAGKAIFVDRCAKCHRLFGEGKTLGPALDPYDRGSPTFWITSIVQPSAEIREGFQSYSVLTVDGRLLTGMIANQDANHITLRAADDTQTVIPTTDVEQLMAINTSLMPEDVLQELSSTQIADLFAYISQGAKRVQQ